MGPVAYHYAKVIIVRNSSTILFSEFVLQPVSIEDTVLMDANTLCGSEPEGLTSVVFPAHLAVA